MYQFNSQSDGWPALEQSLAPYLSFLTQRLDLAEDEVVTLVLGDDALVQPMNAQYRGKDAPTNVLSFNSDAPDELGDLIFARQTIAREAVELNKPFNEHMCHLILHGSLHLLGYDHEMDDEAREMEDAETRIMAEFGLPDPYGV